MSPLMRCHLDSALAMNWSMMTWAPLAKSPNWASQTTSRCGSALAMPYSNPTTAHLAERAIHQLDGRLLGA